MTNPCRAARTVRRLDDDQVQPQRKRRDRGAIGKDAVLAERLGGPSKPDPLAHVHRLLRCTEGPIRPRPHFHDHETLGWRKVDRDNIEFGAAHPNLPPENSPTPRNQAVHHELLGRVADPLRFGSHQWRIAGVNALPLI